VAFFSVGEGEDGATDAGASAEVDVTGDGDCDCDGRWAIGVDWKAS
jgi:hypothetical protein